MADFPPIPRVVSAPLGPVLVSIVSEVPPVESTAEESTLMGRWSPVDRRIHLRRGMPPETLWATLFHEQMHAVLDDSGHVFSEDDKERICDCVALGRLIELRDRMARRVR